MTKQIRVSPDKWEWGKGWRVHKPWSKRDIIHTETKEEAERKATQVAKNQGLETKIQKMNWKIQWWNSY